MEKTFDMRASLDCYNEDNREKCFFSQSGFAFQSEDQCLKLWCEINELKGDVTPPTVTTKRDAVNEKYEKKLAKAYGRVKLRVTLISLLVYALICVPLTLLVDPLFWLWGLVLLCTPLAAVIGAFCSGLIASIQEAMSGKEVKRGCLAVFGAIVWGVVPPFVLWGIWSDRGLEPQRFPILFGVSAAMLVAFLLVVLILPRRWYKKNHNSDPEYQKEFNAATKQDEAEEARLLKELQRRQEANKHRLAELEKEYEDKISFAAFYRPLRDAWESALRNAGSGEAPIIKQTMEMFLKEQRASKSQFEFVASLIFLVKDNYAWRLASPNTARGFIETVMDCICDMMKDQARKMGYRV